MGVDRILVTRQFSRARTRIKTVRGRLEDCGVFNSFGICTLWVLKEHKAVRYRTSGYLGL